MAPEKPRKIEASDIYQITVLESPQWDPSGQEAAFVQLKADRGQNSYTRTIWRWRAGWEAPRMFTNGGKMDF